MIRAVAAISSAEAPGWAVEEYEQILEETRAALDDAEFARAWERGQSLDVDEAVALALGDVG